MTLTSEKIQRSKDACPLFKNFVGDDLLTMQTDVTTTNGYTDQSVKTTAAPSFVSTSLSSLADAGTPDHNVTVEDDGKLVRKEYWTDLDRGALNLNLQGPASPPALNRTKLTLDFDDSSTETVYTIYQLPHSYKEGSNVRFHAHWSPETTDTGNVLWEAHYRWIPVLGAMGSFSTTTLAATANGTVDEMQVDTIVELDGTGKGISSMIQMRLQRLGGDASDTFSGNAQLVSMDIHYQEDSPGSEAEFAK